MTKRHPYRGNGPTSETRNEAEESEDVRSIRRDMEWHRLSEGIWQQIYPDGGKFLREFEQVAVAAQDWGAVRFGQRFRALRILAKHFGRDNARLLTLMAAPKSMQPWILSIRQRRDTEKSDGGRRAKVRRRVDLAHRIGMEVYERIAAGETKGDAIAAVKEAYRNGAPYPQIGDFPIFVRPKIDLPEVDGIEKLLGIFRRNARKRGYVDPNAPYLDSPVAREPKFKVSSIPKRGRPRGK